MKNITILIMFAIIATATSAQTQKTEYVDLGLPSGTLWATCNVGAQNPWEFGNYFAWGETKTKKVFLWSSYTKDPNNMPTSIAGTDMDAATATLGQNFATPTNTQKNELLELCDWKWTTMHNVKGSLVTGPNGNTIFIPAGGTYFDSWDGELKQVGETCFYWTADRITNDIFAEKPRALCLIMADNYGKYTDRNGEYCDGKLIRPVFVGSQNNGIQSADSRFVGKWATEGEKIVFEFFSDGTMRSSLKNTALKAWNIKDNDTIELVISNGEQTLSMPWKYKFLNDNTLHLNNGTVTIPLSKIN